jgi:hypothetical protein
MFLHGLALSAARRALREDEKLYVPPEWEDSSDADEDGSVR